MYVVCSKNNVGILIEEYSRCYLLFSQLVKRF